MINTVIIDDEAKARRIMRSLITEYCPQLNIVGEADDVPNGVKLINNTKPDLVFLDVEMPGYTGFQLLDFFDTVNFKIIFCTAYTEYAIKAFRVSAIDYLLKPIQIDQLIKATSKLQIDSNLNENINALKQNINSQDHIKKIALPVSDGLLFVEVADIVLLKAEGSYTQIHFQNSSSLLVSKKIKDIEELLPNSKFFRTHRSYLIHLDHIKQFVKKDGGYILMDNGQIASISNAKKEEFVNIWSSPGI